MTRRRKKGFTLIELIVAVFIVTILLALTLPSYQRQLRNTRRSLGSAALLEARIRQEQYFLDHKRYAGILTELGFPADPYAIDPTGKAVPASSDDRIYMIELTTLPYAYTLRATPQLNQVADRVCGTLSLDSRGIKLATGTGSSRECW